jgi:hypothetical protein
MEQSRSWEAGSRLAGHGINNVDFDAAAKVAILGQF